MDQCESKLLSGYQMYVYFCFSFTFVDILISSAESQKGVNGFNAVQRYSIENQKGDISI